MRTIFTICFLLFTFYSAHAQQFQWVKGGGTAEEDSWLDNHPEATYYMTTDPNGNIYALSTIGDDPIYADTFYRSQGAYGADANIFLSSYTKSGQMRWAKLIASSSGECLPYGVTADSLGHVYVAGYFTNGTLHIGYDTTIGTAFDYDNSGLMQFDTTGHFNWIQYVGNNNLATALGSLDFGSALVVDGDNNVHFINNMKSGVPIMAGVTSHYGDYDLTYSPTGVLLSAKRLNMDSVWYVTSVTIDPVTNKLFVCGERNVSVGSNPNYASYAATFDTNRNVIWMDTLTNSSAMFNSIVYDRMGHLYFNGFANGVPFSFNGSSIPSGASSVIVKTDTTGQPIWVQAYYINGSDVNFINNNTLVLLPNNLVASTGYFAGELVDLHGRDSIATYTSEGQNPFLSIVDTSGIPMSLLQIQGDGFYDWSRCITSDRIGNVYIGGQVADSIYVTNPSGSIPAYYTVGGNSDFFVMRYGIDSDCTALPVANYTVTGTDTAHARNFTYTGTTAGVDSVVWNFGDTTATTQGMSASHTYDTGVFEACVTVYTSCGMDMHCSRIEVVPPTGVNIVTAGDVQVYPNPAEDELNIKTQTQGYSYRLLTITGASMQSGTLQQGSNQVSLEGFAAGMYLLELKDVNGQLSMMKFVKESP